MGTAGRLPGGEFQQSLKFTGNDPNDMFVNEKGDDAQVNVIAFLLFRPVIF
jgi:hypothetical protein